MSVKKKNTREIPKPISNPSILREFAQLRAMINTSLAVDLSKPRSRRRAGVDARRMFAYIAHKLYLVRFKYTKGGVTLAQIGYYLGYTGCSAHSSVIHLLKGWESLILWNQNYKILAEEIIQRAVLYANSKLSLLYDQKVELEQSLIEINKLIKLHEELDGYSVPENRQLQLQFPPHKESDIKS